MFSEKLSLALVLLFGTFVTPAWAQVVINEIDADNPSSDEEEFVELFDDGGLTSRR